MAKALILGGSGFIGYHLAHRLLSDGATDVLLVDDLSRGPCDADLQALLDSSQNVRLYEADLGQENAFEDLGDGYDQVYLLAGIVGVHNALEAPAKVLRTNTRIVLNTLDWLSRTGCGSLVFSSSSEVYASGVTDGTIPVPTDESAPATIADPREPRSSYAVSKLLGEGAVAHYSMAAGFPAAIVRYHNVYGPRMGQDHVIPDLMQRVYAREDPLRVYGTEHSRTFCYVEDAVRATVALALNTVSRCEVVNIGDDRQEIRIGDLLDEIIAMGGYHPTIEVLEPMDGSVPRRCPDISKLRRMTGYEPRWSLDAGLRETWRWYSAYYEGGETAEAASDHLSPPEATNDGRN